MERADYILMLNDYDGSLAPEPRFTKEWFISDLDLILSYTNEKQRQSKLCLWVSFLEGCKSGRYLAN